MTYSELFEFLQGRMPHKTSFKIAVATWRHSNNAPRTEWVASIFVSDSPVIFTGGSADELADAIRAAGPLLDNAPRIGVDVNPERVH